MLEHCLVCGQVINSGDVYLYRQFRRVHQRCSSERYLPPYAPLKVKIVRKKRKTI